MNTYSIFRNDAFYSLCGTNFNLDGNHIAILIDLDPCIILGRDIPMSVLNPENDYSKCDLYRRFDKGGVLVGAKGIFTARFCTTSTFDMNGLLADVFADLGIDAVHTGNDFTLNGKKICGTTSNDEIDTIGLRHYYGFVINVDADLSGFDDSFIIAKDKVERHGASKVSERVGTIAEVYPNITESDVMGMVVNEFENRFEDLQYIPPEQVINTEEYRKLEAKYRSGEWIENVQDEGMIIMKKIAFSDGHEVDCSSFTINTVNGRERLTVLIPKENMTDYQGLSERYGDATKTNVITASYGNDESPDWIRDKTLTGFTKPIYLAGDDYQYQMVLEKRSPRDYEIENLLARIEALEQKQA